MTKWWSLVGLGILVVAGGIAAGIYVTRGRMQASPPAPASTALQTGQLPPSHPPLPGQVPGVTPGPVRAASVPPPPPASGTGDKGLSWTAPTGWTTETPASPMRRAQYRIAGPGGPAECIVFYFGPGQGGDTRANVARWGSQFTRADGQPASDALKTREIKVGDIAVTLVEVSGTYVGGMGSGPTGAPQTNQMLLGAIAEGPDARWFFRATGPKATLEKERQAFERMIRSIKPGA